MDFRNFFITYVFGVKESIFHSFTELRCLDDFENPGQLPVSQVLEGTDDLSTCKTGSWPEFSRSPEHGSSVKLPKMDSLTRKTCFLLLIEFYAVDNLRKLRLRCKSNNWKSYYVTTGGGVYNTPDRGFTYCPQGIRYLWKVLVGKCT